MEKNKRGENMIGRKENVDSKIPKSTKVATAKETSSKTSVEKKTDQRWKAAAKATITSSKVKQTPAINVQKNVARMSIAKIAKDVMSHYEAENLKTEDRTTAWAARGKENAVKRAPGKEKFSQTTQKPPGRLSKQSSAPELKPSGAFGGMRLTEKRKTFRKFEAFQKPSKESTKNSQEVKPSEPCTEESKTIDSAEVFVFKEIHRSNEGNAAVSPIYGTESSKATSLEWKETNLKESMPFGGMRFSPKWKSTPIRPNLCPNTQEEFKQVEKELHLGAAKWQEKNPFSAKMIMKKKAEAVESTSREAEYFKTASNAEKEAGNKINAAFGGIRLIPKRKSTHRKPDGFGGVKKESKTNEEESHLSAPSNEELKIPGATEAILKTETQALDVQNLEVPSTQKPELSRKSIARNVKGVVPKQSAFGGIPFKPTQKTPRDIFAIHKVKMENQV